MDMNKHGLNLTQYNVVVICSKNKLYDQVALHKKIEPSGEDPVFWMSCIFKAIINGTIRCAMPLYWLTYIALYPPKATSKFYFDILFFYSGI